MDRSTRIDMMKLLVTVAWADDELTKRERDELRRCAREVGLDDIEQQLLFEELEMPPDPPSPAALERASRADAHALVALARQVALADGRLDESEVRLLRSLRSLRSPRSSSGV